ncbi:MFS transporter [Acetobacter oeni]|uniref:MFS transporter n=1 Tax=Acetobacter oeni TaxID=304077 RepID=A0A511XK16_9PROT|nr:MFS transporter [Acetobacter oeni]MBB3883490.1 MHS family proline/betaine transporter-like MFS transporter [Acetobacter oeni]NHO19448.1 MFS transporter [Acetobacter oeni]GBR04123.1 major facilitator superfamily transporter [Acetobacter oeni LMG 21952]GEN63268.1 MFS transporter [Acetobacter oeni]
MGLPAAISALSSDTCPRQAFGHRQKRTILATTLGGALEWYDMLLYGMFSVTFSRLFFSTGQGGPLALALSLGSFGVAFLVRPLGAAWLGSWTDRHGRRSGLILSSVLMTIGTGAVALIPDSRTIGPLAPALLVLSRMTQGFAAGGEFGSASAMLAERDPARRGFYASLQWSASGVSVTLAASLAWCVHHFFTDSQIDAGAWRLPFLFGLLMGPFAIWLRLRGEESEEFICQENHLPLTEIARNDKKRILLAIGVVGLGATGSGLNVYMPTYARTFLHLSETGSLSGTIGSGLLSIIVPPFFASLGDKAGRRIMMIVAATIGGLIAWPLFAWLSAAPSAARLIAVQSAFIFCIYGAYYASVPALLADIFPPRNRASSIALSYAASQLLFGGFTPVLLSILTRNSGLLSMPGLWLLAVASMSVLCLCLAGPLIGEHRDGLIS